MEATHASRTAMATALMRSVHSRCDPQPILQDPWGEQLVPPDALEAFRRRAVATRTAVTRPAPTPSTPTTPVDPDAALATLLRANAAYASVITRSRYAEDALQAAVGRGVRQVVLVGAGFDSYVARVPAAVRHVAIFEIDHPATQSLKRQRLAACGLSLGDRVHFLAADLAEVGLDAVLARSAFDAAEPAFFSWLGVTTYLSRAANLATLRAIARASAVGSELVFTYVDQAAVDRQHLDHPGVAALRQTVTSLGEPFRSTFDAATLGRELQGLGLALDEDLDDAELVRRYDPQDLNRLRPTGLSRIARARVTGRP